MIHELEISHSKGQRVAMNTQSVTVERKDGVALVTYDRRGRANAMSFDIMDELADVALSFTDDNDLRCVVLTGTDRIFSAGMDLSDPVFDRIGDLSFQEMRHYSERGPRLARAWAGVEVPVICAIEGPCLAGGLALASMCDFRVASQNSRFGAPEVQLAHGEAPHGIGRVQCSIIWFGGARMERTPVMPRDVTGSLASGVETTRMTTETICSAASSGEKVDACSCDRVRAPRWHRHGELCLGIIQHLAGCQVGGNPNCGAINGNLHWMLNDYHASIPVIS